MNQIKEIIRTAEDYVCKAASIQFKTIYEFAYALPSMDVLHSSIAFILIVLYAYRQLKRHASKTELICVNGSKMEDFVKLLPSFQIGYRPTIWCLPASTLMTIIPSITQIDIKINFKKEILQTPDGGQIAIFWDNQEKSRKKQVVLILPGIDGKCDSKHIHHLVHIARNMDCVTVVLTYRGIEVPLLTPRFYTASNCDDLDLVVKHIKSKYPEHSLFATGFSYVWSSVMNLLFSKGGLHLGIYLAKCQGTCLITHALVISSPFNASATFTEFSKVQYKMLDMLLTNGLLAHVKREKRLFENDKRFDLELVLKSKSFYEFDKYFISKQFEYSTMAEYYADSSIDSRIQNIQVPTVFLNSTDDMLSPVAAIPLDEFAQNPHVALILTKYGGHVTFAEGFLPTGCFFYCHIFRDYLESLLK